MCVYCSKIIDDVLVGITADKSLHLVEQVVRYSMWQGVSNLQLNLGNLKFFLGAIIAYGYYKFLNLSPGVTNDSPTAPSVDPT